MARVCGEPPHVGRHLRVFARPKDEVPVVWHHAVGYNPHRQALTGLLQNAFECFVVAGPFKEPHFCVAAVQYVINNAPGGCS